MLHTSESVNPSEVDPGFEARDLDGEIAEELRRAVLVLELLSRA